MIEETNIKSALHHHSRQTPLNWDVNPYRGCAHGCTYCFAQYSHSYIDSKDFFGDLRVKLNVAEVLDKELGKKSWKGEPLKIGGVTDPYQPIEEQYRLMPEILEILIKHKNPTMIATKSNLALRDHQLIAKLARVTNVTFATTITTMDEDIQKRLEPGAPSSKERFAMMSKMGEAGCETIVLCTPVVPFLTDGDDNLDNIFAQFSQLELDHLAIWPLHLRGSTRGKFLHFLQNNYPEILRPLDQLYRTANAPIEYRLTLNARINQLREKYDVRNTYHPNLEPKPERQLSLFS